MSRWGAPPDTGHIIRPETGVLCSPCHTVISACCARPGQRPVCLAPGHRPHHLISSRTAHRASVGGARRAPATRTTGHRAGRPFLASQHRGLRALICRIRQMAMEPSWAITARSTAALSVGGVYPPEPAHLGNRVPTLKLPAATRRARQCPRSSARKRQRDRCPRLEGRVAAERSPPEPARRVSVSLRGEQATREGASP